MNRGGGSKIARRIVAALAMVGLGAAVIGGGVALAGTSNMPPAPGIDGNYGVYAPAAPTAPDSGGGMVSLYEWNWL